jgi:arylsulfatase A-like enzyme
MRPILSSEPERLSQRIIDTPHIAADIFPTILEACGGDTSEYELDGKSLMSLIKGEGDALHEYIFWEMEGQTAVRKGKYKLVINGRLEEFSKVQNEYFLSDLESDPGETNNLSEALPEITEELKNAAINWRKGIEDTWQKKFLKNYQNLT